MDSLSTRIASSCEAGSITWEGKPHGSQVVTFMKNTSFTLCILSSSASSSAAVYRLIGPSRRLLVPASRAGKLGCYESQCNLISLLIEPLNSSAGYIELTYQVNLDTSERTILTCVPMQITARLFSRYRVSDVHGELSHDVLMYSSIR